MKTALQLSLFPEVVASANLVAVDNPRGTFYNIRIENNAGICTVIKESGTRGKILDRRAWPAENVELAHKLFQRKVKAKVNPRRKSSRKYQPN